MQPATLAAIVMLDRQDGYAGPPAVEAVATLDAIAALTPETSHLPEMEKPLQRMAALCDAVGGVVRVTYTERLDLAPLLAGWLEPGAMRAARIKCRTRWSATASPWCCSGAR